MIKRKALGVFEWLGRHEFVVLLALLFVVAGTWGFISLADVVLKGRTQSFDESVIRALRLPDDPAKPIGPAWMAEVGRDLTALGGVTVLVLATLAVAGFLLLDRKYAAMGFVLAAVASGLALSSLLKACFAPPATGYRAAPFPGLYQQLPQRTLDDVGHRLPDPGNSAGTDGCPTSAQGLCPRGGLDSDRVGWLQSRLPGRPLPYRCPGGMDSRAGLGHPLLAHRPTAATPWYDGETSVRIAIAMRTAVITGAGPRPEDQLTRYE